MQKSTGILTALACFLGGIILGFLIAPVKKGIYCGNYNGNVCGNTQNSADGDEEFYDKDALPF